MIQVALKILFCASIIFMGMGAFAKTKIALIGDSKNTTQVADLVLVELTQNTSFELLEREEINKITAEHKLANWSHGTSEIIRLGKLLKVDLFAVLRSENKKYFFVVFDAKSAVRLIDLQLTGDSTETLAADMTTVLKQSISKLHKENSLRKISLFSIRNVELPRNKDLSCNRIAAELVRKIGQLPDFAVIEGRYIGLINKERELTQLASSISQAFFLLNIDFYQSDIKDKTLVKLEIKVPGKKSKHFTIECNLKTLRIPPKKLSKIIKYMRQEKQKPNISSKAEAARYYSEYKKLFYIRKYTECLPKLEAAIAYDNSNNTYKEALLRILPSCAGQEYRNTKDPEEKINRYLNHLERWNKLMVPFEYESSSSNSHIKRFSMYYRPLFDSICNFDPLNGRQPRHPVFLESTRKRLIESHRRYVHHQEIKFNLKHWMSPGLKLNSRKGIFDFDRNLTSLIMMRHTSQNQYFTEATSLIKLYLRKTVNASETIVDENINGRVISWKIWNRFFVCFKNLTAGSNQLAKFEEIAKTAIKHPWPFVKLYGTFALYLVEAKKNTASQEKALNNFLNRMSAIFKNLPSQKNSNSLANLYNVAEFLCGGHLIWVQLPNYSSFSTQMKNKLLKIMQQRHELYFPLLNSISRIRNKQSYDLVKKYSIYLNSAKWTVIGEEKNAVIIKSTNEKLNRMLAEYLSKNPQQQKPPQSSPFTVDKLVAFKNRIINAVASDSDKYIYWFSLNRERSRTFSVGVFRYDILFKKTEQIGVNISIPDRPYRSYVALGGDYLAISMHKRSGLNVVIVCNIKTGEITKLKIPFEWPRNITIVNKHLLVWCSMDNNLLEYQLPSFKYKVIYSANRRNNPSDPFNNQTVRVNLMFPDQKRKRAVIMLSGYNLKRPGWWYYYPQQQKFEYVGIYPLPQGQQWNKITQDKVLLASTNVSFILNLKNNTKELLFFTIPADKNFQRRKDDFERYAGGKARVILNNFSTISTAAASTIVANFFWCNPPWYRLDLSTGKKTFYSTSYELNRPALILRTINDKTLLLVNARGIFKLHLTNRDKVSVIKKTLTKK